MDLQNLWGQFLLNNVVVQNITNANLCTVPNLSVNSLNIHYILANNNDENEDNNENDETSTTSDENCQELIEKTTKTNIEDDEMGIGEKTDRTSSENIKTEKGVQKSRIVRTRYSEEYHCDSCPYTCFTEKALLKHTLHCDNSEEGLKKLRLSCPVCGKDRQDDIALSVHMERHRQNKYFCCDMCKFKSIQLKKIILHRRMHTGEKPHLCPYCTYRSSRKDNLRNHTRRVHKKDLNECDTFIPRKIVIRPKKIDIK